MPYTLQDLITEFHNIQKDVPTYRLGQHFINEFIKDSSTQEMCSLWEEREYGIALGKIYELIGKYQWDVDDLPLKEK